MRILLSGGGTLGPVTPLLAIAEVLKDENTHFLFVGTKEGPEQDVVEAHGIKFQSMTAGKLRRYASILNIVDLARGVVGFIEAVKVVWKFKPDVCISAGGYNSVPLHIVAWFFGIPSWIHQQDLRVGLANRIMAPFARVISVALQANRKSFPQKKVVYLGNPVRKDIYRGDAKKAHRLFGLQAGLPTILVTGGGTGSARVNELTVQMLPHIEGKAQVIHITGKGKWGRFADDAKKVFKYYHPVEFLTEEMKDALAVCDIVIARGGFGTLTELAALGKPSIVIPLKGHQTENAMGLYELGAIEMADQDVIDGNYLGGKVREMLSIPEKTSGMVKKLGEHFKIAQNKEIIKVLEKTLNT